MRDNDTALPTGRGQPPRGLPAEERPFKVAEVAKFLGQRPDTVYRWIRQGELEAQRIGGTYFIPRWALAPLLAPAGALRAESPSAPANGHRQEGAG
jgi:excisionase family DNA binding protein